MIQIFTFGHSFTRHEFLLGSDRWFGCQVGRSEKFSNMSRPSHLFWAFFWACKITAYFFLFTYVKSHHRFVHLPKKFCPYLHYPWSEPARSKIILIKHSDGTCPVRVFYSVLRYMGTMFTIVILWLLLLFVMLEDMYL